MTMKYEIHIIIFIFFPITLKSQSHSSISHPSKHLIGVYAGTDIISMIRILIDAKKNNDYKNTDDIEFSPGTFFSYGLYYKYKPLIKWDIDFGNKITLLNIGNNEYIAENNITTYTQKPNYQSYIRVNFSPNITDNEAFVKFFTAVELGYLWTSGKVVITNNDQNKKNNNLNANNPYYEIQLGIKSGKFNSLFRLFLAYTNACQTEAILNNIKKRGFYSSMLYNQGSILFGFNYEFGFKNKGERLEYKREKKKNKKREEIIKKYENPKKSYLTY